MAEQWRAEGGRITYADRVEAGQLVAIDHPEFRFHPWEVVEVAPSPDRDRIRWIVRPARHGITLAEQQAGQRPLAVLKYWSLPVLDEHYAVCHRCGELPPCSEQWSGGIAERSAERVARYEVEGICPACTEPITRRQKTIRFADNIVAPLGPPVTFHARWRCATSAIDYDARVARALDREPRLSCEGMQVRHRDGTTVCTNITCPPEVLRHRSFAQCYVLNEPCNRPECWALDPTRA